MDFNGKLIIAGASGQPELTNLGPATEAADTATKGTLTFPNGFKIQWDRVLIGSNSQTLYNLPEPYTGVHLFVFCSYASALSTGAVELSISAQIGVTLPLEQVKLQSNANATEALAYLSFGLDV